MTKERKRTRIVLADYKRKKAERGVEIEGENGETFQIPPPELWPDDALSLADSDPVNAARALLGDDYPRWCDAGGNAAMLLAIVGEELEVGMGESDASSSS